MLLTTKQPDSDYPTQPSSIASRQKPPPKPAEELDGICIRGIPESTEKEARLRQEHDLAEVQKVLTHMDVNASIGDVIRLGRYDENKTRKILLKVANAYQRRMVLLSARKLKNSPQPIFLSRQLMKEEADLENLALVRRRQLISDKSVDRKDIRVHDATLYIRKGGKWIKEKLSDPEAPNWLSATMNILVYNIRRIPEYQRRTTFSSAVKNAYQVNCLTKTWLTESIGDAALFLTNCVIQRNDRPSDKA